MRDKQIEEMSEIITTVMGNRCWHNGCTMCEFEPKNHCQSDLLATALVEDYGYRKASDVAREIFEEIDNMLLKCISASHKQLDEAVRDNSHDGMIATTSASEVLKAMRLYIAELKKKYTNQN